MLFISLLFSLAILIKIFQTIYLKLLYKFYQMLLNYGSLSKMEHIQKKFRVVDISFAFLNECTNQNY